MEASCFFTPKSFTKTLDFAVPFPTKSPFFCRKRPLQSLASSPSSAITSCSLRPESSGDDREPMIESADWRSFRARLVAGEQAPASAHQNSEKWAHTIHEPEKGCLLVATEKLDGVHIFERTVILLLSTGPLGPFGVILNRPSLMSIKETRSTDLDAAGTFSDRPLFFGGPLEAGVFLVGPRQARPGDDAVGKSGVFEEVMRGLYYGTKESVGCASEMVKRDVVSVGEFRFFDGYCGWEKEQLNDEISAGYWNVVACSPSVVGLTSAGLWVEVLGLVGQKKVR